MITDSHSILDRWRKHCSQLFYIHWVNDVRQTEIHSAEPLVPEPSAFEVEMVIAKLKRHKLPGIDQIQAQLIKQGVERFAMKYVNLLILFGISRNCLKSGRINH